MGHLCHSATGTLLVSLDHHLPGIPWIHHRQFGTGRVLIRKKKTNWQSISAQLENFAEAAELNVKTTAAELQAKKLRVLMAAGGTGGHVYPAIAIADEIKRVCDTAEVEFVGTKDRMEWSVVPIAGYKISAIPAVAIRRPFTSLENLLVPGRLLVALLSCWKLLSQVRPNVVVGTGGYISGPLCLVATIMRCPVVIQEQNAYAGLTSRLLGHVAEAVFIAFSCATAYFPKNKCVLYGNPTRVELRQYQSAAVARRFFFPPDETRKNGNVENSAPRRPSKQVVLVLGGSLGAKAVNEAVTDMVVTILEKNPTRYILWQTGPTYYEKIVAKLGNQPRLAILPYINAMHMAYAASDLVVARAGAITCSELLVTGKPSILIPSTNVAEDHQTKNAMAMAEQGCAEVLPESLLTPSKLALAIDDLLGDTHKLMDMSQKALKAARPEASSQIAEHVIRLGSHHLSEALA